MATNRIKKALESNGTAEHAPAAPSKPDSVDVLRLEQKASDETDAARKRKLCAQIRKVRNEVIDKTERRYQLEDFAEKCANIQLVRDSLARWAEEQPFIGHWEVWNFENGTTWLDLRIPRKDGSEPVVRVMIEFEGE
jgi:hypothetical protein